MLLFVVFCIGIGSFRVSGWLAGGYGDLSGMGYGHWHWDWVGGLEIGRVDLS